MAEITYMNGAELQAAVAAANQAVAGMTFAEAQAALGGTVQSTNGGTQIVTFPLKYTQYGQVSTEAMYASQLWEYWKTAGEAAGTTAIGAAAAAATKWAQGVLIGTGEGLAATAGLLTLSVPTAVAMAAPLLGVGLGAALYDTFPDTFDRIAAGLVDFTTEATQTITAVVDEAGHVLLDSRFVQKLKELFEEEEIPVYNPVGDRGVITGTSTPVLTSLSGYSTGKDSARSFSFSIPAVPSRIQNGNQNANLYVASPTPSTMTYRMIETGSSSLDITTTVQINNRRRYNNTVFYIGYVTCVQRWNAEAVWDYTSPELSNLDATMYQYAFNGVTIESADYPEGTSGWQNSSWAPSSSTVYPSYPVYNPDTGETVPYYPVTPYIGDTPGTTVDPETTPQQDPTSPLTTPELPIIDPYISPVVNPEIQLPDTPEFSQLTPDELTNPGVSTDPVYVPQPDLNPALNPSADPSVEANPVTNLDPAESTGNSPDITFPPVGLPFPVPFPTASDVPVTSGQPGFIQIYNPSPSELVAFGRWLWVTYADATLQTIWNNPFDGVIGAHELYATPSKDGYSTIRSGFLDSGIGSIVVRQRYTQINCGSIIIPEYWGNYLDYSPYSKAYIYLPFIGIQEVDVDDIVGHAVNICYHVDSFSGACIAQITCAKEGYSNTLYQFSGNCSVEIPMAGGSQAAIKAAMMTANAYQNAANISAGMSLMGGLGSLIGTVMGAGGFGISGAMSGLSNAASQYAYGQAQHTANMVSAKSSVQHSGNFGSSHGAMGIKKPYIIIRRPIQKVVNGYNKLYGYPAHKQVIIGNCTGFLRCREVNVVSSLATDEEKAAIENMLKSGVYVTE